jgi:PAS domain S-box-containing protein
VEDIEELKMLEKVLRKRNDELEKLVEELSAELTRKDEQLKREIEERRHGEMKLRASEEMYSSIFTHIGIGISVISPEMEIIFLNTVMKELNPHIDVSKRHICYKSFNVPPRNEVCSYCPTIKTFQDGKVHVAVTDTPTEGGVRHFRIISAPVPSADGSVSAVIEVVEDITERKRAEDALRESEKKFRVLAETSPVAIIVYQREKLVYVNPAATHLIGYAEQECLEMKFWDWAHEDFKEQVRHYGLARQSGEPVPSHYECKSVSKSGEEKWVVVSAGQIEYKGAPAGIASIFDISERKHMEEELLHAREELERRVEERTTDLRNANEHLEREITVRRRTESVNMARLRLLRLAGTHGLDELVEATLDEAEALTGSLIGFYHFLEADQKTLSLQNWSTRTKTECCKAEGKGLHYDVSAAGVWVDPIHQRRPVIHNDYASLTHRKGLPPEHPQIVRELVVPVFRGDNIVAILGVGNKPLEYASEDVEAVSSLADLAWEILERKEAEEALRESRAKYQAIVDAFDGFIYICSQDLRIEFMHRKLIDRTGYDATGESCYKVMHDRDSMCPWCVNDRVFAGETVHWEMFSPKDKRWYYVVNVPIRHADGSMSKHSMMIDITVRKMFEEELERQKQLLQELNDTLEKKVSEEVAKNREKDIMLFQQNRQAAMGEMLDHIAHQWRQPLNSISLIIQELGDTASDGELTDEHVKETVSKTMALLDHMGQTIDVFRGFYRPDKEKKVFSIKDSIDLALTFIAPAFRFYSVVVELEVDSGLTAFGYPKEYAQVLLNILANAKDAFFSRGTEKPRVRIRAFAEDSKTVVTITDNAGGIPEAIIGRIFDFYFTTNESSGGTGIGLYMSKNIIEKNMGGKLSAVSTGEGAQFRIEAGLS